MFEKLFHSQAAIRRHQKGQLAGERAIYLDGLVAQGMAPGTILRRASYILSAARQLNQWPPNHCFNKDEVEALAREWAETQLFAPPFHKPLEKQPEEQNVPRGRVVFVWILLAAFLIWLAWTAGFFQ